MKPPVPALRLLPALDEPEVAHEGRGSTAPRHGQPVGVAASGSSSGEERLWAAIREPGPCTAWLLGLRKEGA